MRLHQKGSCTAHHGEFGEEAVAEGKLSNQMLHIGDVTVVIFRRY